MNTNSALHSGSDILSTHIHTHTRVCGEGGGGYEWIPFSFADYYPTKYCVSAWLECNIIQGLWSKHSILHHFCFQKGPLKMSNVAQCIKMLLWFRHVLCWSASLWLLRSELPDCTLPWFRADFCLFFPSQMLPNNAGGFMYSLFSFLLLFFCHKSR